jgi:LmbE family N-acetylglucosaminyl deacetylase
VTPPTRRAAGIGLALLLGLAARPSAGQDVGASTGGLVALDQALRFLGHHKRVLMIGAHPDDEDTELLTVLVRGMGVEAVYLALTRGEGGQNLIGPELGDALGVLRTEELLAARRLDGARQAFTRAFDFGYSKGLSDTWSHWPRDSVLKDVVRLVRRFRPQVIVSVFSGTSRDGHGQHQAAGWAAQEAFRVAGDPAVFPELAREEGFAPWTPLKLYLNVRFTSGVERDLPGVTLDGGVLDRAVGQSYLQIAARGRSLHRSQDMGMLQPIGPSAVRLALLQDRTGGGASGFFAGVDTSLAGLAPGRVSAQTRQRLTQVAARLHALRPWNTAGLAALHREFAALTSGWGAREAAVRDQLARMDEALFLASDLLCDALADRERLVPARPVRVVVSCWNASRATRVVEGAVRILGREARGFGPHRLAPGALRSDTIRLDVPADAPLTNPYFLDLPKQPGAALYQWPAQAPAGTPFEDAPLVAALRLAGGGAAVREVVFRHNDQARGEIRRPVTVVPPVTVSLRPDAGLWPSGDDTPRDFEVTVRAMTGDSVAVRVALEGPPGWSVTPPQPVRLTGAAPERTLRFTVRRARGIEGRFVLRAVAEGADGQRYDRHLVAVEYPHVRPRQLVHPAVAGLSLAPIALAAGDGVAYVRGAADHIPEALQFLGLRFALLSPDSLARGDLSAFRTVVIGPRAYETEARLGEVSGRLEEFARRGGTVIVQYQQQVFFRGGHTPFPLSLAGRPGSGEPPPLRQGAPRVAEEGAAVTVLAPDHPLFRYPNLITDADWQEWVQERGLYFARSWDPGWTPLLEMADAGEEPQRGGLLVARVGAGVFGYTGLSFFRQLPAGVPGATRLFINLLALDGDPSSR